MEDYPLHSHGLIVAPKILADVIEAAIGAVFIDSNSIETVWKVLPLQILLFSPLSSTLPDKVHV
jgi:dsRNA-specific ribonuclease